MAVFPCQVLFPPHLALKVVLDQPHSVEEGRYQHGWHPSIHPVQRVVQDSAHVDGLPYVQQKEASGELRPAYPGVECSTPSLACYWVVFPGHSRVLVAQRPMPW